MNRITEKYRPPLAQIARIYVESGGNFSRTEREGRKLPGCGSLKAEQVKRWLANAEFAALVTEAEDGNANAKRLRPAVRGPERIAWLIEVEKTLRIRHKDTEGEEGKDKALRALLAVGADIRQEEAHLETLQQRIAQRDFARFLKNLIAWIKVRHAASHATVFPILRGALQNLEAIQSGKFEEIAG